METEGLIAVPAASSCRRLHSQRRTLIHSERTHHLSNPSTRAPIWGPTVEHQRGAGAGGLAGHRVPADTHGDMQPDQ